MNSSLTKLSRVRTSTRRKAGYTLVEEGEEQRYVGWKAEPLGRVQGVQRGYRMRRTPGALPPLKT